ncbi:MAG: undecaprenyl-diphosphate phosphatase [Microbacteriaceae bacterium]|nr:undecaprenyl-diphosphate phosphatase [Microbacteriaceae bacterium]
MNFIEAMILGLLQGLTEFIPVSSSAHLRIAGAFLPNAIDPGATFTAITQLGTEAAVLLYFRHDIARIAHAWFEQFGRSASKTARARELSLAVSSSAVSPGNKRVAVSFDRQHPDVRLGWLIIVGTVPIVIAGFLLQQTIRTSFRSLWIIAIVLIVFGVFLGVADLVGGHRKTLEMLGYRDGLLFGFAQMLALVPGVSRSGATTTLGRALGYERSAVTRFSFLLAVPAVFGSGLYELYHSISHPDATAPFGLAETAVATIIAFTVGLTVIAFLMNYIRRRSFLPFVIYRILLGSGLVVLLSTGEINAV